MSETIRLTDLKDEIERLLDQGADPMSPVYLRHLSGVIDVCSVSRCDGVINLNVPDDSAIESRDEW